MTTSLLETNISRNIALDKGEWERFIKPFCAKTVKKKAFLLQEGEVCGFEAFVNKGCFKIYHIDDKGFEQVVYFAIEGWWITDLDSFINQTPAQLFIQALEDSEVLMIGKADKEKLYEDVPKIERLFRIMTQKTHVALQRRMIDNLSKPADQRYVEFLQRYPQIARRLTNIQIAAYLGVSHEFVSKIRKKLASKG
jgi:CRP-like cAMP-binding protein